MGRILSKDEWKRRKRRKKKALTLLIIFFMPVIVTASIIIIINLYRLVNDHTVNDIEAIEEVLPNGKVVKKLYLTPNPYSRPQEKLKKVKGIVIHYTANPGTTAENNRNYFESLATTKATSVSSHYIIGLEGEIIQCIPLTEIAYASNERNVDTISIECCHEDETGEFNGETYDSLVALTASLCMEFNLKEADIIRHYDVTEKLCPLYYVKHEDKWEILKDDIMNEVKRLKAENKAK